MKPSALRALRRHHADADGALLPDAIVGEQRFVLVDVARESACVKSSMKSSRLPWRLAFSRADRLALVDRRRLVLRHALGQVAVDAARPVVRSVHARAGHRLVAVHQVFALAEAVQEHRHRADVERVRAEPQQMIQDARDLVEHHADVLRAQRHFDAEQLLDRHAVRVLVAHHRHVVEPVHVRQRLDEGLVLGELFGGPVQQADVRIGALDHLAVELEHQAQHAVRRRMLRPEIHGVVSNLSHAIPAKTHEDT